MQEVVGSTPISSTPKHPAHRGVFFVLLAREKLADGHCHLPLFRLG